ncbi:MAG TPA: EpsI family protein [Gemmatimonadaceae bacterium]
MRSVRLFAPAVVLIAGCLLQAGVRRQHGAPLARPLAVLPVALAGFGSWERPMTEAERQVVGATDYLFRIFGRDSVPAFSVYVGYYDRQATGRSIHSPKNCLPGSGYQTLEAGTATLEVAGQTVTVNRYIVADGPSQALVYYWYQGRGRVAHNEYLVKWDLLRDAVLYGRSEEALVRIVVPVRSAPGYTAEAWRRQVDEAEALARAAAVELIPHVAAVLPAWGGQRTEVALNW